MTISLKSLTLLLLDCAAKGAEIARAIRSESTLFNLLIEEKTGSDKNVAFVNDFKTLTDVLIQEVVRYFVEKSFPGLGDHVYGEENSQFTNSEGEVLNLALTDNHCRMRLIFDKILGDNSKAVSKLIELVYSQLNQSIVTRSINSEDDVMISQNDLGIWIDPIDGTQEYVEGHNGLYSTEIKSVCQQGLPCSLVLIGVFSISDGSPIAGVINQPFYQLSDNRWIGREFWGICHENLQLSSLKMPIVAKDNQVVKGTVTSIREDKSVITSLPLPHAHACGSGYKQLLVINGLVDFYVCSINSTYLWDTCAPHAILKSIGGGLVDFTSLTEPKPHKKFLFQHEEWINEHSIKYIVGIKGKKNGIGTWCNKNGLIAFSDPEQLEKLYKKFHP